MAVTYNNIEEYRKKKRRKRIIGRLLLVFGLLALLGGILLFLKAYRSGKLDAITSPGAEEDPSFPLTIKNEQLMDMCGFGSQIALLGKSNLMLYNANGKRALYSLHGYTNPVMCNAGKYLLIYDFGGYKLKLEGSSGTAGELTTQGAILCAALSADGSIAVVTTQENAADYQLFVYDSSLKERYKFAAASGSVISVVFSSLAFSEDGNELAACAVTTEEGELSCLLYELDLTSKEDAVVTLIPDFLPLSVSYQGKTPFIIGRSGIATVEGRKKKVSVTPYDGSIERYLLENGKGALLVEQGAGSESMRLKRISEKGTVSASAALMGVPLDIARDGEHIAVLYKDRIVLYSAQLSLLTEIALPKTALQVSLIGDQVYAMSSGSLMKYSIWD